MSSISTPTHSCVYCGSNANTFKYNTSDIFNNLYSINQCNDCKAYILTPPPTKDQLEKAYDSSYYGEKEEKFSSPLIEKVLDYFRSTRAKHVSKYVSENAKVLDIGCGNGRFLKYLLRFGKFNLYGTEMEGNSATRASRISEIKLKTGLLESGDYPEEFFDAITLFHVFEHLTEPKNTLETIKKILKPNGIAVFSFPNISSFQAKWFKGQWLHLDPPRHLFFFEPKTFVEIMQKQGFSLIKEHHVSIEQNPFGMVQSILNKLQKKREVLFESMKGNKSYIADYSKFNLFSQKVFFVCTMPLFVLSDLTSSIFGKSATIELTFRKR